LTDDFIPYLQRHFATLVARLAKRDISAAWSTERDKVLGIMSKTTLSPVSLTNHDMAFGGARNGFLGFKGVCLMVARAGARKKAEWWGKEGGEVWEGWREMKRGETSELVVNERHRLVADTSYILLRGSQALLIFNLDRIARKTKNLSCDLGNKTGGVVSARIDKENTGNMWPASAD
jgi:hypothetical protein